MNLGDDIVKFREDYGREYCRNILSYSNNNLIYSDEPYEFRIIGGTPDGKIVITNKRICIPCEVKKVILEKESVIIKDSKIISIKEIEKCNNKYMEVKINYMVSFNVRLYDKCDNIYKIRCYLDKYPTPNKQSFTKEFIRAYSIVTTKILINCNDNISYKSSCDPKVSVCSKASIKDVQCELCKQRKFISCYNVNSEEYIKLIVGIIINSEIKVYRDKKCKQVSII